ncbi:flavodoxin [Mobilibacterium timonense]|uniref:flavodoxin n=1 Tax=Mobilibacterium timonense TaxID=1871012 RepID=UPI002352ABD9|nr:flavodoxin [Mobilibacterium timonense]MBM6990420.1 flavodoxin [Mobilibacterium timonense]
MDKVYVVYWSMTGNTEAMAQAVAEGVEAAGKEAVLRSVSEVSAGELKDLAGFALGCPAMGDEVLEEGEFEPFVSELEGSLSGKKVGLFGSYGWGDGQWMRDWAERMEKVGAEVVGGEGVICNEAPDDSAVADCQELGKALAAL